MKVFPINLLYSREHTWVRIDNDLAIVGITDYAQEKIEEIISIEEKIKEIVSRIQRIGESNLAGSSGNGSRSELIAAFLAILHLAYEQMIFLEQKSRFSDIMVRKL